MIRKSFLIQAKEGMTQEYEWRHDNIWPALTDIFKKHGVHKFSINLHKETGYLFGYIEIEDEEKYTEIGSYEVCKKWWKYMTEVLVCERENSDKGKEEILREIFYFEN
jgi:L-rhamnose mutarotase